jgi:hypothetical protein
VPLSVGRTFRLVTPAGTWELESPLFALCGSGTTGCHNDFHGAARLRASWAWDSDADEQAWWSGELLAAFGPHGEGIREHGHWEIRDLRLGATIYPRG